MSLRKHVRIGDCVCLVVPELGGLVYADGHITCAAYVDRREGFDTTAASPDQHRAQFTIVPKLSYTAWKSGNKNSKNQTKAEARMGGGKAVRREAGAEESEKMQQLVLEERALNLRETARSLGETIHYGSVVQLQHSGGKFLAQVKNSSQQDATALQTQLTDGGDEGSWWKLMPAEAVRSDGETVRYADKIWFQSVKFHNCYLSACASHPVCDRNNIAEYQCHIIRMHPQCSQRFETNASPRARKIQIFPLRGAVGSRVPETERQLRGFDVVMFIHRQCNALLSATAATHSVQWIRRGGEQSEWPDCLWRVVRVALEDGGEAVTCGADRVLIQHLTSGMYMHTASAGIVLSSDLYAASSRWAMVTEASAETDEPAPVLCADYVWLRSSELEGVSGAGWLSCGGDGEAHSSTDARELPAGDGERGLLSAPQLRSTMQDCDAIEVSLVASDRAARVEGLADCYHVLDRFTSNLEQCSPILQDASDEERARLFASSDAGEVVERFRVWVDTCLSIAINGCSLSDESDPLKRSGAPVPHHQHLLRQVMTPLAVQIGLLDAAQRFIRVLFEHLQVPLMQVAKSMPVLHRLCKLAYRLMEKAATQNQENKLALLPFFPCMRAHRFAEIGSYFAWSELFKDTPEILMGLSEEEFSEFFNLVWKRQSERIVIVLIQSCHVGEMPIQQNQDRIADWLVDHLDAFPVVTLTATDVKLSFPLLPALGEISVRDIFAEGEGVIIDSDLFEVSKQAQAFRFMLKMLELFGWMVLGRNESVRSKLLGSSDRLGISLQQLQRIVGCDALPWCLRSVCCGVLRRLYVEAPPHNPVQMLMQTRVLRLDDMHSPRAQCAQQTIEVVEVEPRRESNMHADKRVLGDLVAVNAGGAAWSADGVSLPPPRHRARRQSLDLANVRQLRSVVEQMMVSWKGLEFENLAKNRFVGATSQLLFAMTEQGMYHAWSQEEQDLVPDIPEIQRVSFAVVGIICGRTDGTPALRGRPLHRFSVCKENDIIVDVKSTLLDLLQSYNVMCDNQRVSQALAVFRAALKRMGGGASKASMSTWDWTAAPPWTAVELKDLHSDLFGLDEQLFTPLAVTREWLDNLFQRTVVGGWRSRVASTTLHVPEVVNILLDLTRYEYPKIQERALMRLVSYFSQGSRFVELLGRVQLLHGPASVAAHDRIRHDIRQVGDMLRHGRLEQGTQELGRIRATIGVWMELCCSGRAETREEVCCMLHRMGGTDLLVACVSRDPGRVVAGEGVLDEAESEEQRAWLHEVCGLLAVMCRHESAVQTLLLEHAEVLWSLVGIRGLDVELLLQCIVEGNAEACAAHGEAWIRRVFAAMARFHRSRCARWLLLLEGLLSARTRRFKAHQSLTMLLLRSYHRQVLRPAGEVLALAGDDGHNERVRLAAEASQREGDFQRCDGGLAFQLGVLRVLAACTRGKTPAGEAFAASTLPMRDCVRAITWCCTATDGTDAPVRQDVAYRVKEAHLLFLHDVYNQCGVHRLSQEFESEEASLWPRQPSSPGDEPPAEGRPALMADMLSDMQQFATLQSGPDDENMPPEAARTRHALSSYVRDAVVPMISFYFAERCSTAQNYNAQKQQLLEQMMELSADISQADHAEDANQKPLGWRRWSNCLLTKVLSTSATAGDGPEPAVSRGSDRGEAEAAWHKRGWAAFCSAVERTFADVDPRSRDVGAGMKQLGMLLARDDPLPIYEHLMPHMPDLQLPPDPMPAEMLMALLATCMQSATGAGALCELFALVRAGIYLHDPAQPGRLPRECHREWEGMLNCEPICKSGPEGEVLTWMQNKYDALGCTKAAFSLAAHACRKVRRRAVLLLLALLQDRNRRAQGTIAQHLQETQDFGVFQAIQEEVSLAEERVRTLKSDIKARAGRPAAVDALPQASSGQFRAEGGGEEEDFGRMSLVMLQLRLLQFMCEGQYSALQEAMVRQRKGQRGHDLVKACVELLRALQPWVVPALALGRFDVGLVCIQITDTLSEMVQGPNEQIRRALLSTAYLPTANAFLETLFYDAPSADADVRVDGVGVNEIKSWLRQSTVACCLTLFENMSEQDQSWIGNFSVEYLGRQIKCISGLLRDRAAHADAADEELALEPSMQRTRSAEWEVAEEATARSLTRKGSGESFVSLRRGRRRERGLGSLGFGKDAKTQLEEEMFLTYLLLLYLREGDDSGAVQRHMAAMSRSCPGLCSELDGQCKHVELVRRREGGASVEKVFFRVEPTVLKASMAADLRGRAESIFLNVARNNPQEKGRAFLHKSKEVLLLIRWFAYCHSNAALRCLITHRHLLDAAPFCFAILVTLFLLLFYGIPVDPNTQTVLGDGRFWPHDSELPYAHAADTSDAASASTVGRVVGESDLSLRYRVRLLSRWHSAEEWAFFPAARWIALSLSCLQAAATLLNAVSYITLDLPIRIICTVDEHAQQQLRQGGGGGAGAREEPEVKTGSRFLGALPPLPAPHDVRLDRGLVLALLRCCVPALYFAFLSCLSVIGAISSPFLQVFLILDYFRRKDGQLVLKAIVVGGPNLLRSMVLGILVMICFGFYTYAYFTQSVIFHHDLCHSPFQCVSKHILDTVTGDLSTVLGDNFGGFSTPAMVVWEDGWEAWRSFFVFTSIVFWVFLLQGIIQGQIIDAFAEMRSESTTAADDLENRCFISSIERFKFAPFPGEWENRRQARYAWNYIFYFAYLHHKEAQEYNGIENAVAAMYAEDDISFLPIGVFKGPQGRGINEAASDHAAVGFMQTRMEGVEALVRGQAARIKDMADKLSWVVDHLHALDRSREVGAAGGREGGAEGALP